YRSGNPPPSPAERRRRWGSLVPVLAAIVCFLFVVGLRDTPLLLAFPPAPLLPTSGMERDAELTVMVADENEQPLARASVRVFAMRDGKAYFAGDLNTDASGRATFRRLPRGEVWVLGYGGG